MKCKTSRTYCFSLSTSSCIVHRQVTFIFSHFSGEKAFSAHDFNSRSDDDHQINVILPLCRAEALRTNAETIPTETKNERELEQEVGERGKIKVLIRKAPSLIQSSRKIFTAAS